MIGHLGTDVRTGPHVYFPLLILLGLVAALTIQTRVSVGTGGIQSNGTSLLSSISSEGRHVAFWSIASNLVASDTNNGYDVFVHDHQTGVTERVNVSSSGAQANGWALNGGAGFPVLSSNGGIVAFTSFALNLIGGDSNGAMDVFVHDRQTGQATRVSVASDGDQANAHSENPSLSDDGLLVAFASSATNLVDGDVNGLPDIFVHERFTDQEASVWASLGGGSVGSSGIPVLAASGTPQASSPVSISLTATPPSAPALLVVSSRWNPLPFAGGTLWPAPDVATVLQTNGSGALSFTLPWPAGVPFLTPIMLQFAIADAGAASGTGIALSNAIWGFAQ